MYLRELNSVLGPTQRAVIFIRIPADILRDIIGRELRVISDIPLVFRLRVNGAIPARHLYSFMACIRTRLLLTSSRINTDSEELNIYMCSFLANY